MRNALLFLLSLTLVFAISGKSVSAQTQSVNPPLGLVTKAVKAHIGNAALTEGSTIYTGDYVTTEDGGDAAIRIGSASLDLQANSAAHIYTAPYGAVVELNRGTALYTTPGNNTNIVIVASDVRATPEITMADFGRVSLDDPCNITVASQRGQVNVKAGNESHLIEQGKTYKVRAENEISYRKYISPDANDYHDYHEHRPCAPIEMVKGRPPIFPGQSRFLLLATVGVGVLTGVGVWKSLESPDRP